MIAETAAGQRELFTRQPNDTSIGQCVTQLECSQGFAFGDEQRLAVDTCARAPFALLIGGAGVGKTTVLKAIVAVAQEAGRDVHLMAISGRAAKRMEAATGVVASTVARFLSAAKSERLVLTPASQVVIDEASMLDLPTTYRLLRALPNGARMLLVGDAAQLPPIGFGLVFHRLATSKTVRRAELSLVHRQHASTGIPSVAASIRRHRVPKLGDEHCGKSSGVSFLERNTSQVIPELAAIAAQWAGEDWCVLSPIKGGAAGTRAINAYFHRANCNLRKTGGSVHTLGGVSVGDPVIHLVNRYDDGLMNGTMGVVREIALDPEAGIVVDFDGVEYVIPEEEIDERIELAYSISVHKAQGSQFQRVAVVVTNSRGFDHALLYTATTRAVEQLVFVGDREVFRRAVESPPLAQLRRVGFAFP